MGSNGLGLRGMKKWGVTATGCRISFQSDENVPKLIAGLS